MRLTIAGWLFLCVAWTCIAWLTTWCMVRLLRKPLRKDPGQPGIGTLTRSD